MQACYSRDEIRRGDRGANSSKTAFIFSQNLMNLINLILIHTSNIETLHVSSFWSKPIFRTWDPIHKETRCSCTQKNMEITNILLVFDFLCPPKKVFPLGGFGLHKISKSKWEDCQSGSMSATTQDLTLKLISMKC